MIDTWIQWNDTLPCPAAGCVADAGLVTISNGRWMYRDLWMSTWLVTGRWVEMDSR